MLEIEADIDVALDDGVIFCVWATTRVSAGTFDDGGEGVVADFASSLGFGGDVIFFFAAAAFAEHNKRMQHMISINYDAV